MAGLGGRGLSGYWGREARRRRGGNRNCIRFKVYRSGVASFSFFSSFLAGLGGEDMGGQ